MKILTLFFSHPLVSAIAGGPGSGAGHSAGAGSPFNDFCAQVAIYVFLVGFLVSVLLIGGFLIVNLGLLSKRPEDRIGGRTPSDLGMLKNNIWPEEPFQQNALPAEEDAERPPKIAA